MTQKSPIKTVEDPEMASSIIQRSAVVHGTCELRTGGTQMHQSCKDNPRKRTALKPIAPAIALALPNVGSFAASMKDGVSTQAAQSVGEQYGRDSIYAFSADPGRFRPEHSRTRRFGGVNPQGTAAADKPSSSALGHSARSAGLLPPNRPQPYGR